MRLVLIVTPSFPRPSQTFIMSKFLGLLAQGWDIHLVTPESELENWKYYPDLRMAEVAQRVHVLPLERPNCSAIRQTWRGLVKSPGSSIRYWQRTRRLRGWQSLWDWEIHLLSKLAALKPDLLHFEFKWPAIRWIYLKELLACKVMVGLRSSGFDYTQPPGFYDILWRNADALHVLGDDLWQRACRLGCPATLKYQLIPAAIDTSFWHPGDRKHSELVGTRERPLRLLSVSRLEWTKGLEHALQVVRLLVDRDIYLEYDIIGDGKYAPALYHAREQLGLTGAVQFWGAHAKYQVRDALTRADIFLHTAVSEGFCNAVLEAQAMQVPVVCSDGDGLPENVAHEQTGFVFSRRDNQSMAEKIILLSRDPTLRERMGRAGRERVEQHFQIEAQIAAFDAFYREVLSDV